MTTGPTTRREAKDALFEGFASVARALASGRRAEIVELLAQGEHTVDDVARELGQSVANTSHHLRTLARAGLVASRREGTHVHYRLATEDVLDLWWAMRSVAAATVEDLDDRARAYLGDRDAVPLVGPDELQQLLGRDDLVVLDVRPHAEYEAGHIPGAVPVPPGEWDRLDDLPESADVVAYCRGPWCVYADDAVRHLAERGRRARRLADGLPEWRRAGRPVVTGPDAGPDARHDGRESA